MAQKVHRDWDENVNFTDYKTFSYKQSSPLKNPLMDQRVVSGLEYHLSLLGYQQADSDPDMVVTYHGITKEQHQLDTTSFGYGMGPGWRWGGMGGMGNSTTQVRTYTKGTLVIDIYDARTNKMIYRGTGTDTVSDNPDKNQKKIKKMFDKMFDPKKWPPKH